MTSGHKRERRALFNTKVGVPLFHAISHNLRTIPARFGVPVVFANEVPLSRLTPFAGGKNDLCLVRHRDEYMDYEKVVVFSIPFACGSCHIGQTLRCLNERLLEHKRNVKTT